MTDAGLCCHVAGLPIRSWSRAVDDVTGGAIPRAFALSGARGRMRPFTNLHAQLDTAVVD